MNRVMVTKYGLDWLEQSALGSKEAYRGGGAIRNY